MGFLKSNPIFWAWVLFSMINKLFFVWSMVFLLSFSDRFLFPRHIFVVADTRTKECIWCPTKESEIIGGRL